MKTVLYILLIPFALYFCFYAFYWLVLIMAGKEKTQKKKSVHVNNPEVLLILPAYKPTPIFKQVLDAVAVAIKNRNIKVFVLLQQAEKEYGCYAREKGFWVESQNFDHLPGNSYQHALRFICSQIAAHQNKGKINPEFVMLVDKDNLIASDFFEKIPAHVYDQFDVIQGKRLSISTHNAISFFDHITERLNDTMFRFAKQNLGLMIEISGSGALIETDLFLDTIHKLDPKAPGFDKNFMINLLSSKREVRSIFWSDSTLTEEKTASQQAHNPQRVRWFGEQYYNALYHGGKLLKASWKYKRLAPFEYLLTLYRPPRSVQFLLIHFFALAECASWLITETWPLDFPVFTLALALQNAAILIFLILQKNISTTLRYGARLPLLAWHNFFNAFKSIKKENHGKFIHTNHQL
ncbi:MAG: glycosyltransferase [Chryseotalea sp.]